MTTLDLDLDLGSRVRVKQTTIDASAGPWPRPTGPAGSIGSHPSLPEARLP